MGAHIAAFAGSARADSVNKKLIRTATKIARELGHTVDLLDLADYSIPLYNGDLEAEQGQPKAATAIRNKLIACDTIMISTPEYNGGITPLLKNVIDWVSRDEKGKPSLISLKEKRYILLSASPGRGGGERALAMLRSIVEYVGGTVMQPTFSLRKAYDAFDEAGKMKEPKELKTTLTKALSN